MLKCLMKAAHGKFAGKMLKSYSNKKKIERFRGTLCRNGEN